MALLVDAEACQVALNGVAEIREPLAESAQSALDWVAVSRVHDGREIQLIAMIYLCAGGITITLPLR